MWHHVQNENAFVCEKEHNLLIRYLLFLELRVCVCGLYPNYKTLKGWEIFLNAFYVLEGMLK